MVGAGLEGSGWVVGNVAGYEDLVGSSGDLLARRTNINRTEIVDISTREDYWASSSFRLFGLRLRARGGLMVRE
jgi:hypothetical protein